jgi:hypothetical protein
MIKLKGKGECFLLENENNILNNLSCQIIDNEKIKFVFFYEPKEMIEFLYNNKIKFSLEYYGHGSSIYINLSECVFIDK